MFHNVMALGWLASAVLFAAIGAENLFCVALICSTIYLATDRTEE